MIQEFLLHDSLKSWINAPYLTTEDSIVHSLEFLALVEFLIKIRLRHIIVQEQPEPDHVPEKIPLDPFGALIGGVVSEYSSVIAFRKGVDPSVDQIIDQVIGQAFDCRQLRDCPRIDFVKENPADSISECDSLRMGCFYS